MATLAKVSLWSAFAVMVGGVALAGVAWHAGPAQEVSEPSAPAQQVPPAARAGEGPQDRRDRFIVLKTGAAQLPEISAELAQRGCAENVRAVSFLERMDLAYAAADAALTRAGAGTVAELAATGLPAVLVPYPYAPSDHQAVNASMLVDPGAGFMVRNEDATPERLGPLLEDMLDDPDRRSTMAAAAHAAARPHAAAELAAWVLELARTPAAAARR